MSQIVKNTELAVAPLTSDQEQAFLALGQHDYCGQHVCLFAWHLAELSTMCEQIWAHLPQNTAAWQFMAYGPFKDLDTLQRLCQAQFHLPHSQHYWIQFNGVTVGWIAYLNPRLSHRAVELGNIFLLPHVRKSPVLTDSVYLLADAAFQAGCRRLEWKCDQRNVASVNAALRLGFSKEGLFRQDRVVKGLNRDTAWFSILDYEWNEHAVALSRWLSPNNFDCLAQQKVALHTFRHK